jgi:hypothetical protein
MNRSSTPKDDGKGGDRSFLMGIAAAAFDPAAAPAAPAAPKAATAAKPTAR